VASAANRVWALDFVHDQFFDGRTNRVLTMIDTFTRYVPATEARFGFRGGDVVAALERVAAEVGYPACTYLDSVPEFVSKELEPWAYMRGVTLDSSRSGRPIDNTSIEPLNGKFRAECLHANWFP